MRLGVGRLAHLWIVEGFRLDRTGDRQRAHTGSVCRPHEAGGAFGEDGWHILSLRVVGRSRIAWRASALRREAPFCTRVPVLVEARLQFDKDPLWAKMSTSILEKGGSYFYFVSLLSVCEASTVGVISYH